MGLVKMAQKTTNYWEDLNGISPYDRATLYIYCDQCGSFSIKTRIGHRKKMLILFAGVLLAGGLLVIVKLAAGIYWLGLPLAVCILAFRYLWGAADYVCRRCGAVPTERFNTRSYPADLSVLDVPDRWTQKRDFGYFPDDYDLDKALMSPPGLPPDSESAAKIIRDDLEGIGRTLSFILAIPLLMFLWVAYPVFLLIYAVCHWVWTEVIANLFVAESPGKNG